MPTVTAIRPQKRDKERVNVYIDEEYAFSLALVMVGRLRVGQTLTESDIAALKEDDTFEKAKQSAYRLISYRPRSVWEVEHKLRQKAYPEPVIDGVINYLREIELLDDLSFARYWVEQRETFKPRSRLALRHELMEKRIERRAIDQALAEINETDAAYRAAEQRLQRWANLPQDAFREKAGGYLQRRGFPYPIIREVIDNLWQEVAGADE